MNGLKLWVWEEVLEGFHTAGLVCVLAPDEATAWALVKAKDSTAWKMTRGTLHGQDDNRPHDELDARLRPRCVESPEAFVMWGGD